VEHVSAKLNVSERKACKVLEQHRSTQRKVPQTADDGSTPCVERLTAAIIDWARQHGRYGYRRITALLRAEGWGVNHKRVERIWRRGLPVAKPGCRHRRC
jgi:putative transposase